MWHGCGKELKNYKRVCTGQTSRIELKQRVSNRRISSSIDNDYVESHEVAILSSNNWLKTGSFLWFKWAHIKLCHSSKYGHVISVFACPPNFLHRFFLHLRRVHLTYQGRIQSTVHLLCLELRPSPLRILRSHPKREPCFSTRHIWKRARCPWMATTPTSGILIAVLTIMFISCNSQWPEMNRQSPTLSLFHMYFKLVPVLIWARGGFQTATAVTWKTVYVNNTRYSFVIQTTGVEII